MEKYNVHQLVEELERRVFDLNEEYENNGGEVTDYTMQEEEYIKALGELLENDGVDYIGRKLKAKEDLKKSLKAEKDYISRQIDKVDRGIEFLKVLLSRVLRLLGKESVSKNGYKFTTYTSNTTTVNKEWLNETYRDRIAHALADAGIPSYITFTISASSALAGDSLREEDAPLFISESKETVKFLKPRAKKEEE